jgi:hypothetical protein
VEKYELNFSIKIKKYIFFSVGTHALINNPTPSTKPKQHTVKGK